MSFKKSILSAALVMSAVLPAMAQKTGGTDAFGNPISKPGFDGPIAGVGLGSQVKSVTMAFARFEVDSSKRLCLNSELQSRGLPPASVLRNLKLNIIGEAMADDQGAALIVTAKDKTKKLNLISAKFPWSKGPLFVKDSIGNITTPAVKLNQTPDDICLSAASKALVDEVTVTFDVQGPINPPPPPPPPPQPLEDIVGSVMTLQQDGQIAGWACDRRNSRSLQLVGYITVNGRTTRTNTVIADKDVFSNGLMGNPGSNCSRFSGFHETAFDQNALQGANVTIEVRAISFQTGRELSIGSRSVNIPLRIIPATTFKINNSREIYFTRGDGLYCHALTPNQVLLNNRSIGINSENHQSNYGGMPSEMRFQGPCPIQQLPPSVFGVRDGDTKAIYFSNGFNVCHIPDMGMVQRLESQFGRRVTYPHVPNQSESKESWIFNPNNGQMEVVVCQGL